MSDVIFQKWNVIQTIQVSVKGNLITIVPINSLMCYDQRFPSPSSRKFRIILLLIDPFTNGSGLYTFRNYHRIDQDHAQDLARYTYLSLYTEVMRCWTTWRACQLLVGHAEAVSLALMSER